MSRWLILSALYGGAFLFLANFQTEQAIAAGLLCGGVSILVTKLFGMDKKD